jgi:hypothetical protein
MKLDDMKGPWAEYGAMLERSVAINERLLRETILTKVRGGIAWYTAWRVVEIVIGIAMMMAVVSVLGRHLAEPRYLIAVGALAVYTAGITGMSVYLLVSVRRLDYGQSVTAIQRQLEGIRLAEYRAIKWAILGGVVVWLPAPLVLFETLTGIDVLGHVHLPWLAANLVFGVVLLAVGQMLSAKYVERAGAAPWARRLMEALSGSGLRSAASHLAEITKFEREEAA